MDRRPDRQSHHVNRQDQPVPFAPKCHDTPHVPDTKENHVPVYAQSAGVKTVPEWQDHNDAPTALPELWKYREVWHMRLTEYLLRPVARRNIPAGWIAAVYGSCCS